MVMNAMENTSVTLAEAKARLSELTARAAAGEDVVITKRGRPVGRLSRFTPAKQAVDITRLQELTAELPKPSAADGDAVSLLREDARY
jgi:antitoxin (DNA-binding transcriptional repressor) of toxin-antitoxin stability system